MDNDVRKLIEFLAEDCGWPLEEEQIDRSAWPVNNAELGLNDEIAVDSVEIYELRPLTTHQPWGVFFVAVKGTSNLSMTLLRKLLRGLVKKKRASADTSNLQQWNLEDLMFVCSLDEPENTTRYFAHFKEQEKGLPKLMIGARWQDSQSKLEIEAAKDKLKSGLRWPDDLSDISGWRKKWSNNFNTGHKDVIKSSEHLSVALAGYAHQIRVLIPELYSIETKDGPIHQLIKAFKQSLIKDLSIDDFSDMIAQTITYGLFSARASGGKLSGIKSLSESVPITNQFLREFFIQLTNLAGDGPADLDFDDFGLEDLISMLNSTNMEKIVAEFGTQFQGGSEDPVIHFYETFLSKYDQKKRVERGVFYTPQPVVSFIVRSIDQILKEKFQLDDGLADTASWNDVVKLNPNLEIPEGVNSNDPFVKILDPATGTGTFLIEVIKQIHHNLDQKWRSIGHSKSEITEKWNNYVHDELFRRIYGFELLMAPYSIAHMKINLLLTQLGVNNQSMKRANIFLTNTLQQPSQLAKWIPSFIASETKIVNKIKEKEVFTVILGNPPYSANSSNLAPEISDLIRTDYYPNDQIKEQNPKLLLDDYMKFIKYTDTILDRTNAAVRGLIVNHGFIDNPTFRKFRKYQMSKWNCIHCVDLHGNSLRKERSPDGSADKNVFDIKQGVGILMSHKVGIVESECCEVFCSDIWGVRDKKYQELISNDISSLDNELANPSEIFYLFKNQNLELLNEYQTGVPINLMYKIFSTGIKTHRDHFAISFNREVIKNRVEDFGNKDLPDTLIKETYFLKDTRDWKLKEKRYSLAAKKSTDSYIKRIQYRPFDFRLCYLHTDFVELPKSNVMDHMSNYDNLGISVSRSVRGDPWRDILASKIPVEFGIMATRPGNSAPLFPTYLYKKTKAGSTIKSNNFKSSFISSIETHLQLKWTSEGEGDLEQTIGPESIVGYTYGLLFSQSYRNRFSEFLETDFARVIFTSDIDFFKEIRDVGKDLIRIHTFDEIPEDEKPLELIGDGDFEVTSLSYSDNTIWLDKENTIGFSGIPEKVWQFHIGGYQVLDKWLKSRKKKGGQKPEPAEKLGKEAKKFFGDCVRVIKETLDLMDSIEAIVVKNGGFPIKGSDNFTVSDAALPEGQKTLF